MECCGPSHSFCTAIGTAGGTERTVSREDEHQRLWLYKSCGSGHSTPNASRKRCDLGAAKARVRFAKVRIAISGTHGSGKTTLAEDFVAAHRDYVHEPEPYEWLEGVYGEAMGEELTVEDCSRQLQFSVERLCSYHPGLNVIAERSPVDFLAYMLALGDLGRSGRDCELPVAAADLVAASIRNLDLLVVLPLNDPDEMVIPKSEDLALRAAMNDRLLDLITTDEYALFVGGIPRTVEIHGDRRRRLSLLEQAILERDGMRQR